MERRNVCFRSLKVLLSGIYGIIDGFSVFTFKKSPNKFPSHSPVRRKRESKQNQQTRGYKGLHGIVSEKGARNVSSLSINQTLCFGFIPCYRIGKDLDKTKKIFSFRFLNFLKNIGRRSANWLRCFTIGDAKWSNNNQRIDLNGIEIGRFPSYASPQNISICSHLACLRVDCHQPFLSINILNTTSN